MSCGECAADEEKNCHHRKCLPRLRLTLDHLDRKCSRYPEQATDSATHAILPLLIVLAATLPVRCFSPMVTNIAVLAAGAPGSLNQPQYYASYPVASTSSSLGPDRSPRFGTNSSGSPSLSSSGTGANTPAALGALSSESGSDDRVLRPQGSQSQLSAGDGRPATPSERSAPQGSSSDSRSTSPRASTVHLPSNRSYNSLSLGGRLPQARAPSSGAPHSRNMVLTMPRPLSEHSLNALSDPTPQLFYAAAPRSTLGSHNSRRNSGTSSRIYGEFGYAGPRSPTSTHFRQPSASSQPWLGERVIDSPTDSPISPEGVSPTDPRRRAGPGIM